MKVIHIESGLGNQMLSYCEYLAMKKMNPEDQIYIETIIFEIPECNEVICQWNGYELEKIFEIKAPNIKELFSEPEWQQIISEIRETRFWGRNWNYPVHFTNVLRKHGLNLVNTKGDFELDGSDRICTDKTMTLKGRIKNSYLYSNLLRLKNNLCESKHIAKFNNYSNIFVKSDENLFMGQQLSMYYRGNGIEILDSELRQAFTFPSFTDEKNISMAARLDECNAVALNVRRGDAMYSNAWIYNCGYFKRAIKFIRQNVEDPVFVFITDPKSVPWCKENAKRIFGLDVTKDTVLYIDWNKGEDSFRDMQLMTHCKHAIISYSSFGWFGAYLIPYPDKITISPLLEIETTHHF